MFVVGLIITLILIFVASLCGTVIGLLQARPRAGRGWRRKGAGLMMTSAVFLVLVVAYGVAWYIAVLNIAD